MTSKSVATAWVTSDDSLSLGFPYGGQNFGHLIVRRNADKSVDVMFRIDKGQLMCNRYDGCKLGLRFDDREPLTMSAVGASDNSPEVAFISNTTKFIAEAKKAKRIRIAATLYQNGQQVLEFTLPEPLKEWPALPKAK